MVECVGHLARIKKVLSQHMIDEQRFSVGANELTQMGEAPGSLGHLPLAPTGAVGCHSRSQFGRECVGAIVVVLGMRIGRLSTAESVSWRHGGTVKRNE